MVLYINGNYPNHSLHGELVSKLADLGNEITVFVPMKGKELDGKYRCDHPEVRIIYSDCLKTLDRVFFLNKVRRIARIIEKTIDLSKVDCILAGTVYSDGFVAYLLHHKYNIPFSVAVRQTDITYQMKWRPYLNGIVKRVLDKSTGVVFISPSYKRHFDRFGSNQDKFIVIPNAVNDFWFGHSINSRSIHTPLSLIYVGEIIRLKNVCTTISVVAALNKEGIKTEFHIVGSGEEEKSCRALAEKLGVQKQVFFHGWQNGKEKIKGFYDQADIFVMPSHRETFGTVYIEALSQGLPVIYTKGQGIDGYFEDGCVGYGCVPTDVDDIVDKIFKIMKNYAAYSKHCIQQSLYFRWEIVAKQYNDLIHDMIEQ